MHTPVWSCAVDFKTAAVAAAAAAAAAAVMMEPFEVPEGFTDSYYVRTLKERIVDRPCIAANSVIETDVCVVGGGFAGLATALTLAEKGKRVVLLERNRIGAGASGLNGGFCIPGFALEGEGDDD